MYYNFTCNFQKHFSLDLGLPVLHPTMVAASAVDGAVRRHGGRGHRREPRRHMDSDGQQTDEERHQLLLR